MGNLSERNSYIEDKSGKIKTPIEERNGAFVFDLWMPKGKVNEGGNGTVNTGRFQALRENEEHDDEGFVREASLRR